MASLYAVAGRKGLVKVGTTGCFPQRLDQLRLDFKSRGDVVAKYFCQRVSKTFSAFEEERRMVALIRQFATPLPHTKEWFVGLECFDFAVAQIRVMAAKLQD